MFLYHHLEQVVRSTLNFPKHSQSLFVQPTLINQSNDRTQMERHIEEKIKRQLKKTKLYLKSRRQYISSFTLILLIYCTTQILFMLIYYREGDLPLSVLVLIPLAVIGSIVLWACIRICNWWFRGLWHSPLTAVCVAMLLISLICFCFCMLRAPMFDTF